MVLPQYPGTDVSVPLRAGDGAVGVGVVEAEQGLPVARVLEPRHQPA